MVDINLDQRDIDQLRCFRGAPDARAIVEGDLDVLRVPHHVVVGGDDAGRIDDETGAVNRSVCGVPSEAFGMPPEAFVADMSCVTVR